MIPVDGSGPDWATIMTAFGTVGAVVAAVGIAIWSNKVTNDRIIMDRTLANEQARKERVGFVHAWVELDSDSEKEVTSASRASSKSKGRRYVSPTSGVPRGGPSESLRFVVRNDGTLPVYNVVLTAPMFYEPDGRLVLANISVGMLVPNQRYIRPAPDQMKRNYAQPSPIPVLFTDSSGGRWQRDDQGELSEKSSTQMNLDGFLIAWETAPKVNFAKPGISDRTVTFIGQVINLPKKI